MLKKSTSNSGSLYDKVEPPMCSACMYRVSDTAADVSVKRFESICGEGNEDIAILMVKSESIGLNSEGRWGGTPTYWAARYGLVEVVRTLVTEGADINQSDNEGNTPLFVASREGHLPVVQYLVTAGADVNHTTDDGPAPIHAARQEGHVGVVRILEEAGATTL